MEEEGGCCHLYLGQIWKSGRKKKTQADRMFVSPAVSLGIESVIKCPWYTQVYAGKKNPGISFWRQLIF